jgi:phosphoglycerate dehydrogenase-like enzyme
MKPVTLLVLSDPTARFLGLLDELPEETSVAVGNLPEAFDRLAGEADAVMVAAAYGKLLAELWPRLKRVRWVHSFAAGVEHVLFPELTESAVPLTCGRGVFAPSLGEFAAAAVLYFAKDLRRMVRSQEAGRWEQFDVEWVRGKTLGIVGYGTIGRAAAERLRPFGMSVVALRRDAAAAAPDALVDRFYSRDGLEEVLRQADYLLVATPLTDETRGMLGEAELARLKPGAVLINLGRGAVVDEAALARALETRRIRGAALDVFSREPLDSSHPFYKLDNVLLSPHIADHTPEWTELAMRFFLENFQRFHRGEPLVNVVDKLRGY